VAGEPGDNICSFFLILPRAEAPASVFLPCLLLFASHGAVVYWKGSVLLLFFRLRRGASSCFFFNGVAACGRKMMS